MKFVQRKLIIEIHVLLLFAILYLVRQIFNKKNVRLFINLTLQ